MFVALPGFSTRLAEGVGATTRTLHVPVADVAIVAATLLPGQWSYGVLSGPCRLEVVKVVGGVGDTLIVERGQAGTSALAFDVGAKLTYSFTYAEAVDRVASALAGLGLTLVGTAAVTVDAAGSTFKVTVPRTSIAVDCTAQVVGAESKLEIGKIIEAYGCCEINIPTLPPFVFLTSRPYPLNVVESLDSSGKLVGSEFSYPIVEAMDSGGMVVAGVLRDLLIGYELLDEALDSGGVLVSGVLRDVLTAYEAVDEALDSGGNLITGQLSTKVVSYVLIDEALDSYGAVVSGALVTP